MSEFKIRDSILKRTSIVIFFLVILGSISLIRIALTQEDIEDISSIDLPLIDLLTKIETNQLEQSISLERAIRYAQDQNLKVAEASFVQADSSFRKLAKLVDEDLLEAQNLVKRALDTDLEENHLVKLDALLLSLKKLEIDHTKFEEHAFEVLNLLEEKRIEEAIIASQQVEREEDEFNKRVASVLMRQERFTEALVGLLEKEEEISMGWIIALTLVFVIVALILAYFYSFRIWRPLDDIRSGAAALGEGNFETRIRIRGNSITEDIVDAFNKMASRLQHTQKEINKFIEFTYRTSHDLKAPVQNAETLVSMIEPDMSEPNLTAILNQTKESLKQLHLRIDSIGEVNQLRDSMSLEKEEVSFHEVVESLKTSLLIQIKESKAIIKTDFKKETVYYPKDHITSVLQNLLSNSIKYKDLTRPLVIEIKTYEKNNKTFLSVQDTGLGFDSVKYQDQIFKPFHRLHTHKSGSGLGLYIVRTIIDMHGGDIKIKSESKKGTIFLLRLD